MYFMPHQFVMVYVPIRCWYGRRK